VLASSSCCCCCCCCCYSTGYSEADVRLIVDGFDEVGELVGALDCADVDVDRLSSVSVDVMSLHGAQFAHVLGATVVVLDPRRRAVVERSLELRRRHEDVGRNLVNDGATSSKVRLRLQSVHREVHLQAEENRRIVTLSNLYALYKKLLCMYVSV